jgi:FkbM family methyltransferase
MNLQAVARQYSPSSGAGWLLRLPFRLVPRSAVVHVLGGINRGRRWVAGAAQSDAAWIGHYELDHIEPLRKFVQPGMTVYDAGANVGFYTLAFARLVGDAGRVFAFEPEARNMNLLRRHIELNNVRNVTMVQAALGSATGLVGFSGKMELGRIDSGSAYKVPCICLDDFVNSGNPAPGFIKMDIEGAECEALEGARSMLSLGKAVWMMATHGDDIRRRCQQIFSRYHYHLAAFDGLTDPGGVDDFLALPGNR